jgi:ABC-type antimicrobial peptide transport system permease subunit
LSGNDLIIITLASFGCIGLLIAIIGLYGVISQLTAQRSREIGIRMALGADYLKVVRMILSQGGALILCGVAIGLIGAHAFGVIYRQTMPELRLPTFGLQVAVTALLCASGFIACYIPARRAGRIDPVIALRSE